SQLWSVRCSWSTDCHSRNPSRSQLLPCCCSSAAPCNFGVLPSQLPEEGLRPHLRPHAVDTSKRRKTRIGPCNRHHCRCVSVRGVRNSSGGHRSDPLER